MTSTLSACPHVGVWRAWLDHEDPLDSADEHLTGCDACQSLVADLDETAVGARSAFSMLATFRPPSAAETALAREQLEERRGLTFVPQATVPRPTDEVPLRLFTGAVSSSSSSSWRYAAGGLAAMVVLSLVVAFTPQGNAAAAGFLAQFRSQQVVGLEITPQSQADIVRSLNALGNLGEVQLPDGLSRPGSLQDQARAVTLAEASQSVGFALQTPDQATLPTGLNQAPRVLVTPASQLRFTFSKDKARRYFQSTGHPEVTLPDRFDGVALVVSIPAAALLEYGNPSAKDALVVAEAGELVVDVQGGQVSLPELRDFLLGLPGLPQATVNQLRQIQNWNETLPVPIPVDRVNWQSTSFNGNQGLLLNDNSGIGSAAIWHASGHLFGVAGSLRATDLERIADGLSVVH
jgi:hypothetical protein